MLVRRKRRASGVKKHRWGDETPYYPGWAVWEDNATPSISARNHRACPYSSDSWWRCCSRSSSSRRSCSASSSSLRNSSSMLIAPGRGPPLRVSVMEPASSSSRRLFSIAVAIPCTSSRASRGDIPPASIMASARERNLSRSSRLCSLAYTRRAWFACTGVLWRGALKPSWAATDDTVDWALPTSRAIAPWESPPSLSNETILALSSGVSGDLCVIGKAPISSLAMNQRGTHDYLVVAWSQDPGEEGQPRERRAPLNPAIERGRQGSCRPPLPGASPGRISRLVGGPRGPSPPYFSLSMTTDISSRTLYALTARTLLARQVSQLSIVSVTPVTASPSSVSRTSLALVLGSFSSVYSTSSRLRSRVNSFLTVPSGITHASAISAG